MSQSLPAYTKTNGSKHHYHTTLIIQPNINNPLAHSQIVIHMTCKRIHMICKHSANNIFQQAKAHFSS